MDNHNQISDDIYFKETYVDINELRELRRLHKYDEAYNKLKSIYDKSNTNLFVIKELLISIVDLKPDDVNEIKEIADKLLNTKYEDIGYYGYVMMYLAIGNAKEASRYYKKIESRNNLVTKVFNRFQKYECQKEFRDLIFDVDKTIELLNNNFLTGKKQAYMSFDIAEYYFKNKDFENALKYYIISNEKRTENSKSICYYKMGICLNLLGRFKEALDSFNKAISMTENKGDINKILSEMITSLYKLDKLDEALKICEKLEEGSNADKSIALCMKVRIYTTQRKLDEALEIANSIKNINDIDKKSLLVDLIRIYRYKYDFKNAMKYMNELYKLCPNYNPLLKAAVYYDAKLHYENIRYCKTLYGTKYENEAKYLEAKSYVKLRDYVTAKILLEDIANSTESYDEYLDLGLVYDKIGMNEECFNSYKIYLDEKEKQNNKTGYVKGIVKMIDFLISQYEFDEALNYIHKFESIDSENIDQINLEYAQFYFKKQDYKTSEFYYKKLYNTEFEKKAKIHLVVLYRYLNELDKSHKLMDDLENTEYQSYVTLNKVKELKDKCDDASLISALLELNNLKTESGRIKTMAITEEMEILIKMKYYHKALKRLEEAYNDGYVNNKLYEKFNNYLKVKTNMEIDLSVCSLFVVFCQNYNKVTAYNNVLNMNLVNAGKRDCYLSDDEIKDIFDKFESVYKDLNYYTSDLYDIYVIDMEKVVGKFYGTETNYIEIKCEQNTFNIHCIQPTLKIINFNKKQTFTRKKTDLQEM